MFNFNFRVTLISTNEVSSLRNEIEELLDYHPDVDDNSYNNESEI